MYQVCKCVFLGCLTGSVKVWAVVRVWARNQSITWGQYQGIKSLDLA